MKKLVLLSAMLTFVFTLAACGDDGITITVGVDSDDMGNALVEQWENDFPDSEINLAFENYGSVNSETGGMQGLELSQDNAPDVALVIDGEVIGREGAVNPLSQELQEVGYDHTLENVFASINQLDYFYLPAFYDGMVFSWNRTMLEEWDIDLTDSNGDNLPDAIDSWEKIFAMADDYGTNVDDRPTFRDQPILEFYPISLDEVWSGYSSLTAGGWELFSEGNFDDPEFNNPAFLDGLEFIEAFSETNMSIDETGTKKASGEMGWRWEGTYFEGDHPFSLVGTWMDVEGAMEENDLDLEFSVMPTWNEEQLRPLMKTKGFVVNGFTPHEQEAFEVLEWLYTAETMGTMINNSAYLPALQSESDIFPNMDADFKEDFAIAMEHNALEVSSTLPNNPSTAAMDVYYNIDLGLVLRDLWDGEVTPGAAQDDIVEAAKDWMENNNTLD